MTFRRIAQQHDVGAGVVADACLQVGTGRPLRGQGEWNPAIDQRVQAFPRESEFPCDESVFLRPVPLLVPGRAFIADRVGDRQVIVRLSPERRDRREGRRCAGRAMLPDE